MKGKHKITGENLIRHCHLCRNDQETCNYCKWLPEDMSKHKHIVSAKEQIYDPNITWLGRLFGKKPMTIEEKCCCGKVMKVYKTDSEMLEITI